MNVGVEALTGVHQAQQHLGDGLQMAGADEHRLPGIAQLGGDGPGLGK